MAEEQQTPNADVAPPGSSESFNQFKDRILTAVGGYASDNEGHNTVLVTHSKPIGVWNGWEHAGYPEDGNVHMATYDKDRQKAPGGHEEIKIPEHVLNTVGYQSPFAQRFEGEPSQLPITAPGDRFQSPEYSTLKDKVINPQWPTKPYGASYTKMPYNPDKDPSSYFPVGDEQKTSSEHSLLNTSSKPTREDTSNLSTEERANRTLSEALSNRDRLEGFITKLRDNPISAIKELVSSSFGKHNISNDPEELIGMANRAKWKYEYDDKGNVISMSREVSNPTEGFDSPKLKRGVKPIPATQEQKEYMKQAVKDNKSLTKMSEEMGMSRSYIDSRLKEMGLTSQGIREKRGNSFGDEREATIHDLKMNKNLSVKEISEQLNLSKNTIVGAIDRMRKRDIDMGPKDMTRVKNKPKHP